MMELYISGQTLRCSTPAIAANSRGYLSAVFHFQGEDWQGLSKWAHFRQGETVYDLALEEDRILPSMGLSLTVGLWQVYVTGHGDEVRITTVPVAVQVLESGLIDEPLHQIPQSVAEQIDSKASLALERAEELEEQIASAILSVQGFRILGYFQDLEGLQAAVPEPQAGDAYGVGAQEPYSIYVYDGTGGSWVDNGSIQGPQGLPGKAGVTFTPMVDQSGNLSWTNDGGLTDPAPVNIMGPRGEQGPKGEDGKSPYELAVEEGFTGTEATFNQSLAGLASHAAQHQAGGTDPVTVTEDMILSSAVTASKIAPQAVSQIYTATLDTAWEGEAAPYTKVQAIEGILESDQPIIDLVPSDTYETAEEQIEAWGYIYRAVTAADLIAFYSTQKPTVALDIQVRCIRK